jgi:aspartyl-tRNA(Asn)/glutamyl-tRNA(Gln) amidotransferase subunit A
VSRVILLSEAAALIEPYIHRRDEFGEDVLALFDQGRLLPATDYVNAQRLRRVLQREWATLWNDVDLLFTPTAPLMAPKIGDLFMMLGSHVEDVRLMTTRYVRAINVLGWPAISIPLPVNGLPIGLQIIGKPFAEPEVIAVAEAMAATSRR